MTSLLDRRTFVVAALAAAPAAAFAQPGPGAGPGPGPGPRGGMMGYGPGDWDLPRYLDRLKQRIGVTAAEDGAWKDYADMVTGSAAQMRGLHQTMFEAMGTADWQERRQMMENSFAARQEIAKNLHEAALKLLDALTPAQRRAAAGILPGLGGGLRGGHMGGPGMMRRR